MHKFPVEILKKIFDPLHQTDKIECIRVCHAWKKAIENAVLFKTIRLRSKDQLHKLVAKMHGNTAKSDKIEKLIFEIKDVDSAEIDILCYVFFNVRELIFYERVDNINDLRFTKILPSHPWSRTIKRITEVSSHLFTDCILKGGLCSLLTEITISGQKNSLSEEFIGLLGNAPELKDLTLSNFRMTLANLESLHEKAVWLSSLSLNNVQVNSTGFTGFSFEYTFPFSDVSTLDIVPSMAMTKLVLDNVTIASSDLYINFQKYITRKYPAIKDMVYSVSIEFYNSLDECIRSGLAPQMEQIGRHLTSLTCGKGNLFKYIFPLLDQSNCRLQKLVTSAETSDSVIEELAKSKQAQTLQTLSLCGHINTTIIRQFTKFPVLTELHLVYSASSYRDGGKFNVNCLVDTIGNTIVDLELANIEIVLPHLPVSSCPNLKTLRVRNCWLPLHMDYFICHAFPNLRTLIIDHCTWFVSSFNLPNLNLSYIELRDALDREYVLVETLCNNERRWYTAHKVSDSNPHPTGDPSNFPAVKSLPYHQYSGDHPAAMFVCNSLNSFFLVHTKR